MAAWFGELIRVHFTGFAGRFNGLPGTQMVGFSAAGEGAAATGSRTTAVGLRSTGAGSGFVGGGTTFATSATGRGGVGLSLIHI